MKKVSRYFVLIGLGLGLSTPIAQAEIFSSKKSGSFKSKTKLLDTRARDQYKASIRLQPRPINTPRKWVTTKSYDGRYSGQYLQMARDAARRYNIPEDLFLRLVQQESNWKASARSHKGAIGLAQLMPATARSLGVNPHDPYENLDGGARYLSRQYREFGSWRLALAAYNAGPGAVKRYGGVPPFKETRNYVKVIWGS